jgi:vancomycin resistance protein YoaR
VSTSVAVDSREEEQRPVRWPNVLLLVVALLWLAALGVVAVAAVYEIRHAQLIHRGVWVSYVDLSDLTEEQAAGALEAAGLALPTEAMVLRYGDREWPIYPQDLRVSLDVDASVAQAFQVGRGGSLREDLREQLLVYRDGRFLDPQFTLHEGGHLAYTVALAAQEINRSTHEATFDVQGLDVLSTPGQSGLEVDQAATVAALEDRVVSGGGGEVELVARVTEPAVADLSHGEAVLNQVMGSPLQLEREDERDGKISYVIERATLAEWMSWDLDLQAEGDGQPHFSVELDEAAVRTWVNERATELAIDSSDAEFDFDPATSTLSVTVPSVWGRELDVEATVQSILEGATSDDRSLVLPVVPIKPAVAMEDADEMGIVELVTQATTFFKGSSAGRAHNIAQAASRFERVLIPPDGIFSFNEHLGEVSEETGYEESLIIWGDATEVGIGGGVCQVSTTAFQAAVLGGFPIVERYPHGYVVSWYGDPGLDATVYAPQVDLKFRNDSDHYLLIKTETDLVEGTVTFNFYGTSSGRTVEILKPVVENIVPPPPPVYTEDPELPEGTIKRVDWAVEGKDATVKRIVRLGDKVLSEDIFFSRYRPWAAKFTYGPGTILPPGALPQEPEPEPEPEPVPEG